MMRCASSVGDFSAWRRRRRLSLKRLLFLCIGLLCSARSSLAGPPKKAVLGVWKANRGAAARAPSRPCGVSGGTKSAPSLNDFVDCLHVYGRLSSLSKADSSPPGLKILRANGDGDGGVGLEELQRLAAETAETPSSWIGRLGLGRKPCKKRARFAHLFGELPFTWPHCPASWGAAQFHTPAFPYLLGKTIDRSSFQKRKRRGEKESERGGEDGDHSVFHEAREHANALMQSDRSRDRAAARLLEFLRSGGGGRDERSSCPAPGIDITDLSSLSFSAFCDRFLGGRSLLQSTLEDVKKGKASRLKCPVALLGAGRETEREKDAPPLGSLKLEGRLRTRAVFLDVDGVLHPLVAVVQKQERQLREECLEALRTLLHGAGADVVLSSTWRYSEASTNRLNAALAEKGLRSVVGKTPRKLQAWKRNEEILGYLAASPFVSSFVVLDDLPIGLPPSVFVRTNLRSGMSKKDAANALEILQGSNGRGRLGRQLTDQKQMEPESIQWTIPEDA
uniref:FCP1 homology domain-containing protein n=1 Tax=Chromera velia CCMP2878 TaxID=1169474 RepID=A0A0G4H8M3_9ALVE|mmetsp:Transcript_11867/g.22778  ORF Transcript_11867/g.22778 Transcript_11867/m.22778 type:complete len:507 (+) Transcript_11867:56-1576(+)|eukprot:Cvel_25160.t1-p1 / transcript=Cvel_25160.t1 / gene=Cvel_25160 / organism=Chromera_velia_CCMP2878 / gene_product=hypothetical protein / transcript_product=hypothetical protein / location=Cvel_scaffold2815:3625-8032(-) / protein_length=506 / sequence_SO=supercontig / SO=protein_coding / is_pseudo=false